MKSVWTMGEMLVEIMRPGPDIPHDRPDAYLGPYPSGAPAIFADAAARMGAASGIVGGVGTDGFGACLLRRLTEDGVDCRFVRRNDGAPTGAAFVTYDSAGEREFIFHIKGTAATDVEVPPVPEDAGFFHIMGCSLTVDAPFREKIYALMRAMARAGAAISFDPNIRPELLRGDIRDVIAPVMERCSILMPGVGELLTIAGADSVPRACEKLFENPVLEMIVLKNGKEGASVIRRDGCRNQPAFPVEQEDPTGAGDCFDGAFIAALAAGKDTDTALRDAAAAGAVNAAAFGPMEGRVDRGSVDRLTGAVGRRQVSI